VVLITEDEGTTTVTTTRVMLAIALAVGAALPVAAQQGAERRGFFGVSMTCEDCFIQRAPGRVAYTRFPAISSITDGSAAEAAGLRTGDTVVAIEGLLLTTPEGFERWAYARPNVPVRLTVRRQGQEREVTVTPTDRSSASTTQDFYRGRLQIAQRRGLESLRSAYRSPMGWLGIGIECTQCEVMTVGRRQQTWSFSRPPAVEWVDVDGPSHRAGLRRGDTLIAMDGVDLTTREGGRAFGQIEPGQRITLTVQRDGRERRVSLVAVPRPDASREELAAFQEFRSLRDSAATQYREQVTTAMSRAQAQMRELELALRNQDVIRASLDSTRRRLAAIDSVMRALREVERARLSGVGSGFELFYPTPPRAPKALVAPMAPMAPTPPTPPVAALAPLPPERLTSAPLRYSGRLAEVVNIEARAPGRVSVDELGDSAVVVTAGSARVSVTLRCLVPAAQVRSEGDSIIIRSADPRCRKLVVTKP
jgi:hypothetical protein